MIASTFSIVAVPLSREFKASRMVLMLAMTAISAATAVISPLIGNLMDRASMRTLMLVGSASVVSGFLALSLAGSFLQVIGIYAVFMAPANVLIGPMAATVLLSRWFAERRGRALGIALAGISIGGFVFPPIMQALLDGQDWRGGLRLLALILPACTIPAAMLVVNSPAQRGLEGEDTRVAEVSGRAPEPPPLSSLAIVSDPTFWLIAAVFAVVMAGMKGMVTPLAMPCSGTTPERSTALRPMITARDAACGGPSSPARSQCLKQDNAGKTRAQRRAFARRNR